ncbi:MAG: hypothetical protein WCJ75_12145 [Desulfomonile sp.]
MRICDIHRLLKCSCLIMGGFLFVVAALPSAFAQDLDQIYKGVIKDQLRSSAWFQDAPGKGLPQDPGGLGALYNLGLMNDLGQEGLREQLESSEWFRKASQPGPQDIKTLFQQQQ